MSKNFDQNFSLKDWVTKRAANMPEVQEENIILQVQNGVDLVMRAEKIRMTEQLEEPMNEAEDNFSAQRPMTARISGNLSTPSVPASPAQQIQIVRLLRDLGDRLRQSEKEREILWKELDSCRRLLTDIEDKTTNTEKAYLTIESKINAQNSDIQSLRDQTTTLQGTPAEETEDAKSFRKNIEDKINALETTTGSAVLRLEDAITENSKLARRLEQVTQDRTLLLNKIEEIQETLAETQDTLRAKALVLLTDHALAGKTNLPQSPAWSGNDTLRTQAAPTSGSKGLDDVLGLEPKAWWKKPSAMSMSKGTLASLVVLGLAGGWALSKIETPAFDFFKSPELVQASEPSEQLTQNPVPAKDPADQLLNSPPVTKPAADEKQAAVNDAQMMNEAAKLANQIEPGAIDETAEVTASAQAVPQAAVTPAAAQPVVAEETTAEDGQSLAKAAEVKAQDAFDAQKPAGDVAQRIKPDTTLSPAVKAIEKKAFAGDAEAQHDLAAIYTAGHAGVKTNYAKAALWFSEAAHNGIGNAQYNLAVLYHQGLGVKQDTQTAINLYRVAASENHPEAQYNLGIAHIEGIGADYNPQIAAYYFQKAAEGGVIEAAYNLGLIQENGLLGEAQPNEAIFWYKLAANRGNQQARDALAQLSKQMNLSNDQVTQIYKQISSQKPEALREKVAEVQSKPVAAVPVKATAAPVNLKAKPVAAAPVAIPAKVTSAVPAPAAPSYDPVIVAQIQEQLIRLGLFSGSADGTADTATQSAVKSYQAMNKLKADGKPTEDVLVHMLASDMQAPASGSSTN